MKFRTFLSQRLFNFFIKTLFVLLVFTTPLYANESSNSNESNSDEIQIFENQWFIYKKNKVYRGPFVNKYQVLATWHKEKIPEGKKYYIYLNEIKVSNIPSVDFENEYLEISDSIELFGEEAYNDYLVEEEPDIFTEIENEIENEVELKDSEVKIEKQDTSLSEDVILISEEEVQTNEEITSEELKKDEVLVENTSQNANEQSLKNDFFEKKSNVQKSSVKRYKKEYLQDYIPIEKPTLTTDYIQEPTMQITNPDLADSDGKTLLMNAAKSGNDWEIKQLIEARADVNKQDKEGWTALMYAVRFQDNVNIVNMLLKAGADVKIKNNFGNSALIIASCYNNNPDILNQLLNHYDASSTEVLKSFVLLITSNNTAEYTQLSKIQVYLNHSTPINSFYNGKTPLMYAAEFSNSTQLIKLLLDNDAIATLRSTEGKNAFDYAVDNEALVHDEIYWSLNKQ